MKAKWIWPVAALLVLGAAVWWYIDRQNWPRGEALAAALESVIAAKQPEQAMVASAILGNYRETRTNASRWSGVYWTFTFGAAILSALAALCLKLETVVRDEKIKKDVAATLSVVAALLITLSSSGDFQRKWHANRIAAAELEHVGYTFLRHNGENARQYLDQVAAILKQRHLSILGQREHAPGDVAERAEQAQ